MIVDGHGAPVQGATVLPDDSDNRGTSREILSDEDIQARISDAQGIVHADLDQYFWDLDGCYHFRVHRSGFEDLTMSVSKDLYPSLLRINLEAKPLGPPPSPVPQPTRGQ